MNSFRRAAGALVVASVLVTAGCAGPTLVGSPSADPSGTTTPVGPESSVPPTSVTTDPGHPAFLDDPEAAVIRIDYIDAGVGGINGVLSTVIYGDGTILRPDPDGGWTIGHLAPGVAEDLAGRAASSGLLTSVDYGDPGVTDMGWSTMTLTTAAGQVEHRVYAPGWDDGLTDEQLEAREHFSDFTSAVAGLDDADLTAPSVPYVPDRLLMTASSGASADPADAVAWPGSSDLRTVVGATGCAVLTGDDLVAVAAALPTDEQPGAEAWLLVSSGTSTPALVLTRTRVLLPHDPGCPTPGSDTEPLPEPWPADDRGETDAWQRWIADQALVGATEDDLLGRDVSSTSDLTWYSYRYSTGTVDGVSVIDVVGTSQGRRDRDPETFSVRVDATTGDILDHQVG